jgi:hypothetical protein
MQKERAAHPFGNGILTLLDFKCPNSRSILLDFVPILWEKRKPLINASLEALDTWKRKKDWKQR